MEIQPGRALTQQIRPLAHNTIEIKYFEYISPTIYDVNCIPFTAFIAQTKHCTISHLKLTGKNATIYWRITENAHKLVTLCTFPIELQFCIVTNAQIIMTTRATTTRKVMGGRVVQRCPCERATLSLVRTPNVYYSRRDANLTNCASQEMGNCACDDVTDYTE